jgi:hypothetical protein
MYPAFTRPFWNGEVTDDFDGGTGVLVFSNTQSWNIELILIELQLTGIMKTKGKALLVWVCDATKMRCILNVSDTNMQAGFLKRIAELFDILHFVCDVATTVNEVNWAPNLL